MKTIKYGSDRPNWRYSLRDVSGDAVDLRDAKVVRFFMYDALHGDKIVDDYAEVLAAPQGEIQYEFTHEQIAAPGVNFIEILVDWENADRQFFPIDKNAYRLRIVESPRN